MRIAQIAPLYEVVPPRLYGGTERVIAHLGWRCGSVPEVVEHGVTGLIVDDEDQTVDLYQRLPAFGDGAPSFAYPKAA
jgi:hypothetical protein